MAQQSLSLANLQAAMSQNNTKMKEWVNAQIGNIELFSVQWVSALPTENISESTIYLIKDTTSTAENNVYTEYVYNATDAKWEILGQFEAAVDLTGYYTKTEADALLANLAISNYTSEEITAMVNGMWSE